MTVPNPDVRGRQEILELYLAGKPLSPVIDVSVLARGTPGFSGAGVFASCFLLHLSCEKRVHLRYQVRHGTVQYSAVLESEQFGFEYFW